MARFDVYPDAKSRNYLLDVQADLLDSLNTRIVVPLLSLDEGPQPADRLNPVLQIKGEAHVMATQFMAAVPTSILKRPVTNLSENTDEITNALDMVFFGF